MVNKSTVRFALLFVFFQLSVISHRGIPFTPHSQESQESQQQPLASQANALITKTNNGRRMVKLTIILQNYS